MPTNLRPKNYSGVPAGTPIITDFNQAPKGSFLYQLPSGHAMHHDPDTGETKFYDSQGQPTNQLEFLDAHGKATSYGDPNAYNDSDDNQNLRLQSAWEQMMKNRSSAADKAGSSMEAYP